MYIIKSLLDTDLYKFTMMQFAFFYKKGDIKYAEYALKCRSGQDLRSLKKDIKRELDHLMSLKFSKEEVDYLRTLEDSFGIPFKKEFLDYLENDFSFKESSYILEERNNELVLRPEGPWLQSIHFEVPCLAIIQELYFRNQENKEENIKGARKTLDKKIEKILANPHFKFADMGTRRRYSFEWHREVVKTLKERLPKSQFLGTSDVLLAKEFGLKPIGTQAHEFFQAMQVLASSLANSQKEALEEWAKIYKDSSVATALTDIFGMDVFLKDLSPELVELYKAYRQDSGDPVEWGNKLKNHLTKLGYDTKNFTAIFSDGLTVEKALDLLEEFDQVFNVLFGIGTNLTNDFPFHKAMSLVMKMVTMNGSPTIKLSDSAGKIMCEDDLFIEEAKKMIENKLK